MHSLESKVTQIVELWVTGKAASKYQDLTNSTIEAVADMEDQVQVLTRERNTAYKNADRNQDTNTAVREFLSEIAESHHQQCYLVDRFACVSSCIGCKAEALLKLL